MITPCKPPHLQCSKWSQTSLRLLRSSSGTRICTGYCWKELKGNCLSKSSAAHQKHYTLARCQTQRQQLGGMTPQMMQLLAKRCVVTCFAMLLIVCPHERVCNRNSRSFGLTTALFQKSLKESPRRFRNHLLSPHCALQGFPLKPHVQYTRWVCMCVSRRVTLSFCWLWVCCMVCRGQ